MADKASEKQAESDRDSAASDNGKGPFVETVEVAGHIIDSLILPKVLDCITSAGASHEIKQINIGHGRNDRSFAVLEIYANDQHLLEEVLDQINDHGAVPVHQHDCRLVTADLPGVLPEGFYSSTNQLTEIRVEGKWVQVLDQEMDCGILYDPEQQCGRCVAMSDVQVGMQCVVGHAGVRVFPERRDPVSHGFQFMNSAVSTEKPKGVMIRQIAESLVRHKLAGEKTLVVGGPAIVHTGSGEFMCELIRLGCVHKIFAGNALAAHDIEQAMFGTSLGVRVDLGDIVDTGHEHHLRAINRIRRAGSIAKAVEEEVLTSGVMYECVKHGVEFLLAGSIRDDGPLPDVITDAVEAQRAMRAGVRDIHNCLMIATTLHSVAVGNLLPASVPVVCVDINPSTVIKLNDRGSSQTTGMVTDVEPFLRSVVHEVQRLLAN